MERTGNKGGMENRPDGVFAFEIEFLKETQGLNQEAGMRWRPVIPSEGLQSLIKINKYRKVLLH